MIPRKPASLFFCAIAVLLEACVQNVAAFQASLVSQHVHPRADAPTTQLFMGKGFDSNSNASEFAKGRAASTPAGDFAYQEMLVYFNQMQKDGVTSRTMDPTKRSELEGFVRTVLANRKGLRLQDIGQAILPKSEWKLMFSTSEAVLESLPSDATVFLKVSKNNAACLYTVSGRHLCLTNHVPFVMLGVDSGSAKFGLRAEIFKENNGLGFSNS
jgi:hypothetical protein